MLISDCSSDVCSSDLADFLLQCRDHGAIALRRENPAVILDHQFVDPGPVEKFAGLLPVKLIGMDRALAEDQPADRARPESFGVKQTILEIVDIVHALEADDALHAVRDETLHPEPASVIRSELDTEHAIAAIDDWPACTGTAVAQRPKPT